ncbi:MAG: hypothetical protein JWN18_537 [Parcubacteria group bacterium]|nr:hypothetical protein [Parcubacteria group bacterium]
MNLLTWLLVVTSAVALAAFEIYHRYGHWRIATTLAVVAVVVMLCFVWLSVRSQPSNQSDFFRH